MEAAGVGGRRRALGIARDREERKREGEQRTAHRGGAKGVRRSPEMEAAGDGGRRSEEVDGGRWEPPESLRTRVLAEK